MRPCVAEILLVRCWSMHVLARIFLHIGYGLIVGEFGDVFCTIMDSGEELVKVVRVLFVDGNADSPQDVIDFTFLHRIVPGGMSAPRDTDRRYHGGTYGEASLKKTDMSIVVVDPYLVV